MRKVDAIVVHCTAHPDRHAFGIGVREIRADHVAPQSQGGRGWIDVGYHYVIRRNGEIECGRMESRIGAHCPPMNKNSIGVAWVGLEKPTSEQRESLVRLTRELMERYGVPVHRVFGHKEADPGCGKACPVVNMIEFRTEVGQ
jgi:N-acetylmuramoyl-L-alanine amidase